MSNQNKITELKKKITIALATISLLAMCGCDSSEKDNTKDSNIPIIGRNWNSYVELYNIYECENTYAVIFNGNQTMVIKIAGVDPYDNVLLLEGNNTINLSKYASYAIVNGDNAKEISEELGIELSSDYTLKLGD